MQVSRRAIVISVAALFLTIGVFVSSSSSETASKSPSETASSVYIGNSSVLKTCFGDYCTGDTGPGGGTIAYVDKAGFGGSSGDDLGIGATCLIGTCHYLEMALADLEGKFSWQGAIVAAEAFSTSSANDWVLPSRDALNFMYKFPHYLGNFGTESYWSSSENNRSEAWNQNFGTGFQTSNLKAKIFCIRPVRAF